MTRTGYVQSLRNLAHRLIALGANLPDPETMNDPEQTVASLLDAIVTQLERRKPN